MNRAALRASRPFALKSVALAEGWECSANDSPARGICSGGLRRDHGDLTQGFHGASCMSVYPASKHDGGDGASQARNGAVSDAVQVVLPRIGFGLARARLYASRSRKAVVMGGDFGH